MENEYTVGRLARFFGVSADTLRLYDRMGIVSPRKDPHTHYRYYSREDLTTLAYVMCLRGMGLPLEKIRSLLYDSGLVELREVMRQQEKTLVKKIEQLQHLRGQVHDYYRTFDNALCSRDAVVLRENEAMLYKPVESSLLATMEDFRRLTQNSVAKFTLVYGRELFDAASEQEFEQVRRRPGYAVTLKDDEGLRGAPGFPAGEFRVLAPRKCVFSMLHTGLEESGPKLLEVRDFIRQSGLRPAGDIWLRMTSVHVGRGGAGDHFEVWVPVEE